MTESQLEPVKKGFRLTPKRIGWILLALVWIVGLLLIWIGNLKIAGAQDEARQANERSIQATKDASSLASDMILDVRKKVQTNDLGIAKRQLETVNKVVSLIKTITPPENLSAVNDAKAKIGDASDALDTDPKKSADLLDEASQILYKLGGESASVTE